LALSVLFKAAYPAVGEVAASFVCIGIASGRALPTSSADRWYPLRYLVSHKRLRREVILRGRVFVCDTWK